MPIPILVIIEAVNKFLSGNGKKFENGYRAFVIAGIAFLYFGQQGIIATQQATNDKLDSTNQHIALHEQWGDGKLEAINSNFQGVERRFTEVYARMDASDKQLTSLADKYYDFLVRRSRSLNHQ